MTDLTYCYLHMTRGELAAIDTDLVDQLTEEIEDLELHIPDYLRPPDPRESEALPEEIHDSYPFGSPLHDLSHPASRPRRPMSTAFLALLNAGPGPDGIYTSLQWEDLGLDAMSVLDPERVEAERRAEARRLVAAQNYTWTSARLAHQTGQPQPTGQPQVPQPAAQAGGQPAQVPPAAQTQAGDNGDVDLTSVDDEDETGDETASTEDESGGPGSSERESSEGEEHVSTNDQPSDDTGSTSSSTQSSN